MHRMGDSGPGGCNRTSRYGGGGGGGADQQGQVVSLH